MDQVRSERTHGKGKTEEQNDDESTRFYLRSPDRKPGTSDTKCEKHEKQKQVVSLSRFQVRKEFLSNEVQEEEKQDADRDTADTGDLSQSDEQSRFLRSMTVPRFDQCFVKR